MDRKTNKLILGELIALQDRFMVRNVLPILIEKFPFLSEELVIASLLDLKAMGCIDVHDCIGEINILVHQTAIGKVREWEEEESKQRCAKYQTWSWDILKLLLAACLGYALKSFTG